MFVDILESEDYNRVGFQEKSSLVGWSIVRVSQEEKDRSHVRIVEAASRIFRERGMETTSLADVMQEAGLTHGGFYRHFETKEALAAAALDSAFQETVARIQGYMEASKPEEAAADFKAYYLSQSHIDNPRIGCPVAALGGEIGRGLMNLKENFKSGLNRIVTALAPGYKGSARSKREKAIRELAMMAGAVAIARACDPETGLEILRACLSEGGKGSIGRDEVNGSKP